jgi:hypothetical protein
VESLDTKYDLEPRTCHKLDIDSGRTKDLGDRLTYELRNYVTTLPSSTSLVPLLATALYNTELWRL